MYGYVYLTTNLINNRKYIGQKKSNVFLGTKYLGSGKILKQAIELYGKDNFKVEMLCECSNKEELDEKEIYFISKYNAQNDRQFYNICKGGEAGPGGPMFQGKHHTNETRQKMSAERKGKLNSNYGNRWHCNERTKQLHSKLSSGSNNGMYGKKHSEATKANIGNKNRIAQQNRTTITNGKDTKHIKNEELATWLANGWYKGTSQQYTDEFKQKMSESTSNKRWVNNGVETKYINKQELNTYLENGWITGRIYKRK